MIYILVLDSLSKKPVIGVIPDWVKMIESNPARLKVVQKPRSQNLPYCYNWFINQMGVEAVTYEEGDEIDRKTIEQRARVYAKSLMSTLLDTYDMQATD